MTRVVFDDRRLRIRRRWPRDRSRLYFLKLGSIGFGGPAALVGYMRRDLVEDRQLIDESTYNLSIALAQIMPGPLAAQTAMAIGYFQGGVMGASLVGLAFILPSFLMVLVLSVAYVAYGGMSWMQAVFYGIGAVIIAIIAVAAYRLARGTNKTRCVAVGDLRRHLRGDGVDWQRTGRHLHPLGPRRPRHPCLAGPAPRHWCSIAAGLAHRRGDRSGSSWPCLACSAASGAACAAADPPVLRQGRVVRVRQRPGDRAVSAAGSGPRLRLAHRPPVSRRRRGRADHARAGRHYGGVHRLSGGRRRRARCWPPWASFCRSTSSPWSLRRGSRGTGTTRNCAHSPRVRRRRRAARSRERSSCSDVRRSSMSPPHASPSPGCCCSFEFERQSRFSLLGAGLAGLVLSR